MKREPGTYFKCVRSDNKPPSPYVYANLVSVAFSPPMQRSLALQCCYAEVHRMIEEYKRFQVELDEPMYEMHQHFKSNDKWLEFLQDRWEGPFPKFLDQAEVRHRVIEAVLSLAVSVRHAYHWVCARYCSEHFDLWFDPEDLRLVDWDWIKKWCARHEHTWGPYWVAYDLTHTRPVKSVGDYALVGTYSLYSVRECFYSR